MTTQVTVGVLALQGAFHEHLLLLQQASSTTATLQRVTWDFIPVRTPEQLTQCDALIIPGGESTTVSLVAARSNLLEPLRDFVKVHRKPTWGTCAGLILLAESANRTKKGGQELIGGLDVRVNRNYFGRQADSFETALILPFLAEASEPKPFKAIFIRAPVVEKLLPTVRGAQSEEGLSDGIVNAPARDSLTKPFTHQPVRIMATLPRRDPLLIEELAVEGQPDEAGEIIAVMQQNVFGTSFHPELTHDARIHSWWLEQVQGAVLGN